MFKNVDDTVIFTHSRYGDIEIGIVDYSIENDGIGAYEYCGMKGIDTGSDWVLVESISVVSVDSSSFDSELHKEVLEDINKLFDNGEFDIDVIDLPYRDYED